MTSTAQQVTNSTSLSDAEKTLTWLADWYRTVADEDGEDHQLKDAAEVEAALKAVREAIARGA